MTATELLTLTPDALIALTNRGLLKRAATAVAAGEGPSITEETGAVVGDACRRHRDASAGDRCGRLDLCLRRHHRLPARAHGRAGIPGQRHT